MFGGVYIFLALSLIPSVLVEHHDHFQKTNLMRIVY